MDSRDDAEVHVVVWFLVRFMGLYPIMGYMMVGVIAMVRTGTEVIVEDIFNNDAQCGGWRQPILCR